jgi:hypothetical protein
MASGSGTFTLGSITYSFDVENCYLDGETDPEDQSTLFGTGETDDGKKFRVSVHRIEASILLTHSVSLQILGGDVYEALRVNNGQMWVGSTGAVGPLIIIDGSKVSAEGGFSLNDREDNFVPGKLEANCG